MTELHRELIRVTFDVWLAGRSTNPAIDDLPRCLKVAEGLIRDSALIAYKMSVDQEGENKND
jgi:hypothetical protein